MSVRWSRTGYYKTRAAVRENLVVLKILVLLIILNLTNPTPMLIMILTISLIFIILRIPIFTNLLS